VADELGQVASISVLQNFYNDSSQLIQFHTNFQISYVDKLHWCLLQQLLNMRQNESAFLQHCHTCKSKLLRKFVYELPKS
jgi:hypothetical protein